MNYFDEIESYLDGSLDEPGRRAFEAELLRNPALARETQLRRELEEILASGPEDALRQNLNLLGERYKNAPAASGRRWFWVFAIFGFATIFTWLLLKKPEPAPVLQTVPPAAAPVDTIPQMPPAQNPPAPKKEDQPPEPIAASYKPNPVLESMMGSHLRGGDLKIKVDVPGKNARLKAKNGVADFRLQGHGYGLDQLEDSYRVKIFSNKKRDYEEGQTFLSLPLTFNPDGLQFDFRPKVPLRLPPGLYYYLIENEMSGAVIAVGKFEVY